MAEIRDVRAEDFAKTIAGGCVLVEFRAAWCGVCKRMDAVVEQAAVSAPGSAVIARIDVDEAPELAAKYEISTVPAFLRFQDRKLTGEFSGMQTKTKLVEALQ